MVAATMVASLGEGAGSDQVAELLAQEVGRLAVGGVMVLLVPQAAGRAQEVVVVTGKAGVAAAVAAAMAVAVAMAEV